MFKDDSMELFQKKREFYVQNTSNIQCKNIMNSKITINDFYLSHTNPIPKLKYSYCKDIPQAPFVQPKKMKIRSWNHNEEYILFKLHKELGNKWSEIAHQMPGKDDNAVKNYFYCKMRKIVRMLNKGIINYEIRRDEYSVWQTLYLLDHVKSNYISQYNQETKGDKYIIEMLEKGNISETTIENYMIFLLKSISSELRKKINCSDSIRLNSFINNFIEDDLNANLFDNMNFNKLSSLPLPSNMYNPRFKLLSLENCDYSFLWNSIFDFMKPDNKSNNNLT